MFCSNCGNSASNAQKFCRFCGAGLADGSEALADAGPIGKSSGRDERSRFLRLGFILLWGGILLASLIGIVGAGVESFSARAGEMIETFAGIGGLVMLAGVGTMIYSRLIKAADNVPLVQFPRTGRSATNSLPPPQPSVRERYPSSITEHTTYNLEPNSSESNSRL